MRGWRSALAAGTAYAAAAYLCQWFAIPPGNVAPLWLPAGVAVAALVYRSSRARVGVLAGAFSFHFAFFLAVVDADVLRAATLAACIAGGALLEAVLAASLVRGLVSGREARDAGAAKLRVLVAAGPMACVSNATIGTVTLVLGDVVSVSNAVVIWWTWWIGEAAGILIILPLVALWRSGPQNHWTVRTAAMVGVVASLAVWHATSTTERGAVEARFRREAERCASSIEFGARLLGDVVHSLRAYVDASGDMTRETFARYAGEILRHSPYVTALEWAPRVRAIDRERHVSEARLSGWTEYAITDVRGRGETAGARDEYFPILYVEPRSGNEDIVGVDLGSESVRREALTTAALGGHLASTPRIGLLESGEEEHGILMVEAVIDPTTSVLKGFVVAAARFRDLVTESLVHAAISELQVRVVPRDRGAAGANDGEFQAASVDDPDDVLFHSQTIDVGGRDWDVEVRPSRRFVERARSPMPTLILAVGLILTALGSAYVSAVFRETRERRQAAARLSASERRHRDLYDNAPSMYASVSPLTRRIHDVNQTLCATLGYEKDELIGRGVDDLYPTRWLAAVARAADEFAATGVVIGREMVLRRKDGSEFDVVLSASAVRDSRGRIVQSRSVFQDITPIKEAERQLAAYRDHLKDLVEERTAQLSESHAALEREIRERKHAQEELDQKNRELETLLYATSHDLREPIRAIVHFSRIVNERNGDVMDEKSRDMLERIERAARRMDRLIEDFLALSRIRVLDLPERRVPLETVVRAAIERLEDTIHRQRATVRVEPGLPVASVNETWATEAAYNLIENALKYRHGGEPAQVRISPYRSEDGSEVGFVVEDRGPGVDPNHAERIFEMFQRGAGRDFEGTGAGLAIVRQVAERHGGRAWVANRDGGGASFVVSFANAEPTSGVDPSRPIAATAADA